MSPGILPARDAGQEGMELGAVIGLDPGERRIGVALAVAGGSVALPLTVIERAGRWLEEVVGLVESHRAGLVVVGLALGLNGSEGAAAHRAREFAGLLAGRLEVPVQLCDERLSTVEASRALRAGGVPGRKSRAIVDRSAAAIILQSYLDGRGDVAGAQMRASAAVPPAPAMPAI